MSVNVYKFLFTLLIQTCFVYSDIISVKKIHIIFAALISPDHDIKVLYIGYIIHIGAEPVPFDLILLPQTLFFKVRYNKLLIIAFLRLIPQLPVLIGQNDRLEPFEILNICERYIVFCRITGDTFIKALHLRRAYHI